MRNGLEHVCAVVLRSVATTVTAVGLVVSLPVTSVRAQVELPREAAVSAVEVGLERHRGGGGCAGRCMHYRIVIRAPGIVEYEDFGDDPRDPPQRRTIQEAQFLQLFNAFLAARVQDAPSHYPLLPRAFIRDGVVQIGKGGAIDVPTRTLWLKVGTFNKSVSFEDAHPPDIAQLEREMNRLGGPESWKRR